MEDNVMPIIIGILIILLGCSNMKGNISSIHSYHTKRVSEEDRLPFARLVGLGTIICGVSIMVSGCLNYIVSKTQIELISIISTVVLLVGVITGISLTLYAIIKYNKGLI